MKWSKISHVGLVRKNNEDNSCVYEDIPLLAVADGMGGHRAGEIASKLALEAVTSYLREHAETVQQDPGEAQRLALKHANMVVFSRAQEEAEKFKGMGTTICTVIPKGDKIYIAHVGDSRVYLLRGQDMRLLTVDHSLVNELIKNGGLSAEEAKNHPQRNVLTRAIGTSPSVEVDISVENVAKGDVIILCTDGLSNRVNLDEIKEIAGQNESLGKKARLLIERALDQGGDDNITVVLYQVD